MDNCIFCDKNRFKLNGEIMLPTTDSIIYENEDVIVCPDLSPLALGHVLIISKKHYLNDEESMVGRCCGIDLVIYGSACVCGGMDPGSK